jgi:hypothetical protein
MSSPRPDAGAETSARAGTIRPLLDSAFGFFVWAAHFLTVYVAAAVACQLGLGGAAEGTRAAFLAALALVTAVAAAVVVLHAVGRYRRQRGVPEQRFRMRVTIGCDAIAGLAIAWQLLAIRLVPLCA